MLKNIPPSGHKIYFSDFFKKDINDFPKGYWFNSGTTALYFLLRSLKIRQKSKIIIPAYTCPSVAAAVLRAGHKPVLCDVNIENFSFDKVEFNDIVDKQEAKAVVAVNLFGLTTLLALDTTLPVILDNAQSAEYHRKYDNIAGCIFSFGRGKPINALEGGLAVIKKSDTFINLNESYEALSVQNSSIYLLKLIIYKIFFNPFFYGLPACLPMLKLGETIFHPNFPIKRISSLNKSIIANIFKRYNKIEKIRSNIIKHYDEITTQYTDELISFGIKRGYRYPILIKNQVLRNQLIFELKKEGIHGLIFYPYPLNKQPGLKNILADTSNFKNADLISKHLITLPVNEFMNKKILHKMEKIFLKIFK